MRIYISVDMEGVSGVTRWEDVVTAGHALGVTLVRSDERALALDQPECRPRVGCRWARRC